MSPLTYSLAAIIPNEHKAAIEALGVVTGLGAGDEYSVPLSADGSEPATHWGLCHGLSAERYALSAALKANPSLAPPVPGYTAEQITDAIGALTWATEASAGAQTRSALFEATIDDLGLIEATS